MFIWGKGRVVNAPPSNLMSPSFGTASSEMLLAVLDQSPDCIKILGEDATLDYMNRNGQCAMEIDDFCAVAGQQWASLWPGSARHLVEDALEKARAGEAVQFRAECPTAKGTARWWDVSVKHFETDDGQSGFISISRDITEAVQAQQAAEAVAAEMRHRLGNAYHVVGSLMSSYARGEPDKEAFASDMLSRLSALAAAQSMRGDKTQHYRLEEVLRALTEPYEIPATPIRLSAIHDCTLNQSELDALAMVFGELCVNSVKHGALSAVGDVVVTTRCEGSSVHIRWSETSNRPLERQARDGGKGLTLMKRVLRARRGDISYEWRPNGLDAVVQLRGLKVEAA